MNRSNAHYLSLEELPRSIFVAPRDRLIQVIEKLNQNALQIAFVRAEGGQLLGTITDGDIRRAILAGKSLDTTPAREVMNASPMRLEERTGEALALSLMRQHHVHCIPVVRENGEIAGAFFLDAVSPLSAAGEDAADVVLMVGGRGERLRPYTDEVPKPMLPLGGKPILEHIIERFIKQGYRRFWLAVNYKATIIEDYFGNGEKFSCDIRYLREEKPLGTAGALSLLPREEISDQIFVMNGDLLTDVDFSALLDFHVHSRAEATIGVTRHNVDIPFGVVQTEGIYLKSMEEKPSLSFLVNAGIYVMNKEALSFIPPNEFFVIPALFDNLLEADKKVSVFPLHESWADIGTVETYERYRR